MPQRLPGFQLTQGSNKCLVQTKAVSDRLPGIKQVHRHFFSSFTSEERPREELLSVKNKTSSYSPVLVCTALSLLGVKMSWVSSHVNQQPLVERFTHGKNIFLS